MKQPTLLFHRREFLRRTSVVASAVSVVPGSVLGLNGAAPPSRKLNIACVGIGGRGASNVEGVSGENLVALCDVDWRHAAATFAKFPNARKYQDFRKMLEELDKQIDAVVVSTPDHTHAVTLMRAIQMGKHVFTEKPMAHSIHEVRALRHAAREKNVATQLGNQGHAWDTTRQFCEWIAAGAIGPVREVHAMCASSYGRIRLLNQIQQEHPVPETLNWDLWLGPAHPKPYNPLYLPGKWRGWSAFGTGVIGDWTCHVLDPVFWALDLGAPSHIQAETFDYDPKLHAATFPSMTILRYDFPAHGSRPAVKVTWYDGAQRPPRPPELAPQHKLPDIGAVVIGDHGKILYGSHGAAGLRILPEARAKEFRLPAPSIPRSPGHHQEWLAACRGEGATGAHFDYGGPLTEIALLGIIAMRFRGQKLEWDSQRVRFPNCPEANELIRPPYRPGWAL